MNSLPRVFMIGRLLPAVAALLVFCSICVPYAAMAQEHPAHEWGYSGNEGPAHWGELSPNSPHAKPATASPQSILSVLRVLICLQFSSNTNPARSTSSIMATRLKSTTLPAVS